MATTKIETMRDVARNCSDLIGDVGVRAGAVLAAAAQAGPAVHVDFVDACRAVADLADYMTPFAARYEHDDDRAAHCVAILCANAIDAIRYLYLSSGVAERDAVGTCVERFGVIGRD